MKKIKLLLLMLALAAMMVLSVAVLTGCSEEEPYYPEPGENIKGQELLAEVESMGFSAAYNTETDGVFEITVESMLFWNVTTSSVTIRLFDDLDAAKEADNSANAARYENIVVTAQNDFSRWLFVTVAELGAPESVMEEEDEGVDPELQALSQDIYAELNRHLNREYGDSGFTYATPEDVVFILPAEETRIVLQIGAT